MKKKRVFFLGAGFSKALNSNYPTLSELTNIVENNLYKKYCNNPILKHYEQISDEIKNNIENLLSYLYLQLPWQDSVEYNLNKALYNALIKLIGEHIKQLPLEIQNPDFYKLADFMCSFNAYTTNCLPKYNNHIITLNYDNLYEFLQYESNIKDTVFQLGNGNLLLIPAPKSKLNEIYKGDNCIKLLDNIPKYSSIPSYLRLGLNKILLINYFKYLNLTYKELKDIIIEKTNSYSFIKNKIKLNNIDTSFVQQKILKLHGSILEKCIEENNEYKKINENESIYENITSPYIIPPVADKSLFYNSPNMHSLWKNAFELLSTADEIYIIGFSFPQTDGSINFLFQSAIKNSKVKVYVINNSSQKELEVNYNKIFSKNIKINYTYCDSKNALLDFTRKHINKNNINKLIKT